MYYSGMILEISEKYCIVMTDKGYFYKLKIKDNMRTGDHIYFTDDDILHGEPARRSIVTRNSSKRRSLAIKAAAVAVAMIVCVLTVAVPRFSAEKAYATVSVDMGIGMQVDLDDEGRVISAESYDHVIDDAEINVIKGRSLDEFWEYFSSDKANQGKTALIGYSSLSSSSDIEKELESDLKTLGGERKVFLKGTCDDVERSREMKETLGNYLFSKADNEDNIEDILKFTSREDLLSLMEDQDDDDKHIMGTYIEKLDKIKERDDDYYHNDDVEKSEDDDDDKDTDDDNDNEEDEDDDDEED